MDDAFFQHRLQAEGDIAMALRDLLAGLSRRAELGVEFFLERLDLSEPVVGEIGHVDLVAAVGRQMNEFAEALDETGPP